LKRPQLLLLLPALACALRLASLASWLAFFSSKKAN
jgi:hypothetical protein